MELVLNENGDVEEKSPSNNTDIVSNIERAMENPQIRSLVGAMLANNGIDPTQLGLDIPDNSNKVENMDNSQNVENVDNSQSVDSVNIDADTILQMIDSIAEQSPMGENTTLGMVKQHIQQNPEEINQALEQNGL